MEEKIVPACFYRTESGNEPVRDWLKDLDKDDRVIIGSDIKYVQFNWPVGMPICRSIRKGLYEVRSNLPNNRIARTIFCLYLGQMVLLHGFIKKTEKISKQDLDLALDRKSNLESADDQ
jgi:phage-related protein